ncbi:hypothetical protein L2E82_12179 [Cichorium intybus]|uniref:Uncharacterized protein n=1 Tax=Cichorium intybus TaxID=13427 RepID=A0ACB9GGF2_CICIN|nr:hypothetical protein L2E82_12179 [Cichorium intybus]
MVKSTMSTTVHQPHTSFLDFTSSCFLYRLHRFLCYRVPSHGDCLYSSNRRHGPPASMMYSCAKQELPEMAEVIVTMEVGSDGVALITISSPPVNALAVPSKNGRFSGGFDINVFQKVHKTGDICRLPDVSVALVSNTIEDAKKPIVAAVQGLALGGGLELAMGCHARVAAPKAQLGLPELSLGVMPGFGGTQRLPRILGLSKAIDMMLTSKPILSEEGAKLGLIDAIVPPQELLKVTRKWALDIAEARKPWVRSLHRTDKIGSLSEAREIINGARQHVKRGFPNLPQHQACLDVIEEDIVHGGYAGVLKSSKKRGLSLEEKTEKMLQIFYDSQDFYLLKELENLGLRKGVISQSVKDVVQTLVDDDLVSKDKIETSHGEMICIIGTTSFSLNGVDVIDTTPFSLMTY